MLDDIKAKGSFLSSIKDVDTLKRLDINYLFKKYGLFIVLIAVVILLSLISDVFFTAENLMNIVRQISINGILAVGMTFILLTGGIDLSIGALMAVAAVIAASIVKPYPELVLPAVLVAVLASGTLSAISGLLVSKVKVAPFIATLAMMTIARGIAMIYTNGRPIMIMSDPFLFIGKGYLGPIPILVIILIIVIVIAGVILNKTNFGRYIYAIGGNKNAALVSGVNVPRITLWVYILNGVLCGLAGIMLASRIGSGQPNSGTGYEIDAIAAVVIGGTSLMGGVGSLAGTVAGVLIIGIINNGLNLLNVSSYYQQIVKGLIIVGAVILDQRAKSSSR